MTTRFYNSPESQFTIFVAAYYLACVASISVGRGSGAKNCHVKKERGVGGEGKKRLQTNPWILKTAHFVFHAWLISCCHQAFKSQSLCSQDSKSWITVFFCLIRIIQGYSRCQRFFFFLYFRDEAAIVSGKATHQSQRVWILCKHFLLQVINLDRGYRSFTTKKTLMDPG